MDDIIVDTFSLDAENIQFPNKSYDHQVSQAEYERLYLESVNNGNKFWENVCRLYLSCYSL